MRGGAHEEANQGSVRLASKAACRPAGNRPGPVAIAAACRGCAARSCIRAARDRRAMAPRFGGNMARHRRRAAWPTRRAGSVASARTPRLLHPLRQTARPRPSHSLAHVAAEPGRTLRRVRTGAPAVGPRRHPQRLSRGSRRVDPRGEVPPEPSARAVSGPAARAILAGNARRLRAERRSPKWIYIFTFLGLIAALALVTSIIFFVLTKHLVTWKQRVIAIIHRVLPEPILRLLPPSVAALLQPPPAVAAPALGAPPQ